MVVVPFIAGGLKNMPGRYYHYTKQAELTVRIESVQKYNVTAGEIGRFPCDPYAEHGNYRAPRGWGGENPHMKELNP